MNLKGDMKTSETIRRLKCTSAFFFVLFIGISCATVNRNKVSYKTKKSYCSLAQLVGHNTYYYSDHYQRKLKKITKGTGRK
jgi:hypothetical protein